MRWHRNCDRSCWQKAVSLHPLNQIQFVRRWREREKKNESSLFRSTKSHYMNMWARNRKICRLDLFVEPEICVDHVIRYVGISVRCSENTFLFVHQQSRRKCVEYASIENKIHTHSMHLCIDISWCEPIEFHAIFFPFVCLLLLVFDDMSKSHIIFGYQQK